MPFTLVWLEESTDILHEGGTGVAQAHAPVDAFAVLGEIEKRLSVA